MSMNACPVEVLALIVSRVPLDEGLRILRTVDRTFCALTTPLVFRCVHVKNRLPSAQGLAALMDREEIAKAVEVVVFRWCNTPGDVEDPPTKELTYTALGAVFSQLHRFPTLAHLDLNLCPDMYPEPLVVNGTGYVDLGRHPSAAGIVEFTLLQALLRGSSRLCLKSLTLANISGYPYEFYKSQGFVEVLSSIEHLHVSVHNGMYSIDGPRSEELSDWMWLVTVPANLLGPTQARLTSLTLMSDLPVGRSPRVDLSPLFFPMLRYLELGGFIFDHHRRTEDFIVRQGQTLTTLVLDSCSMYMSLGQDPIRPWRDVCDRFAETLGVLIDVQFHIREGWGLDNRKRTGEVR